MRIGIYGGSFDPIHEGHLHAAREVRRARDLDQVWFVPAGRPPHKRPCEAPFAARLAMVRSVVEEEPGLAACDLEGNRPGPSYTVDTLEDLSRLHPGSDWELLVGADMLADLPRWHRAAALLGLVTVAAFGRPGVVLEAARDAFVAACPGARLELVGFEPIDVSSTGLRAALRGARSAPPGLPPRVFALIRKKGLYGAARGG